ncbi:MAG: 50S ribosomal protein L29 [Gammaproteobacteria bacterium]|nr:50S ribosomal protein L29 [Gammaproteobacteria bacterium]
MNAQELRAKKSADLSADLTALLKEQFNLRMQKATGQLSKTSQLKAVRRDIARVKMVLNEKQPAGSGS